MDQLKDALDWIKGLEKFGIKPGLERMKRMLGEFGNPQNRLKFVHIAGTNGKGSTVKYISTVLREAGYQVGTFTSPAMDSFTDRIQFNGDKIPDADFMHFIEQIKPIAKDLEKTEWGTPTEFEVTTVVAILYFAMKCYPDIVVWETGLGGRLDSTNVITPLISVITNIGFDHMNILGDSIEQIASEKAGIIKNGFPCVTSEVNPVPLGIIEQAAKEKRAPFYRLGAAFTVQRETDHWDATEETFSFQGPFGSYSDLVIRMAGEHQVKNAALSVMVLELLRQYYAIHFEYADLKRGLSKVIWPGRFEIIPNDPPLILDGAHNAQGAEALVNALRERFPDNKVRVLFSALKDKDVKGIIERLSSISESVIITQMDHDRSAESSDLQMIFRDARPAMDTVCIPNLREALQAWRNSAGPDELLLATGSLYLIAEIRKELGINEADSIDFLEKAGD